MKTMKKKLDKIILLAIVGVIFATSIGYSALNSKLMISGNLTYRPDQEIRVTGFFQKGTTSNMTVEYADYSKKEVKLGFTPSATTATVTYEVTVQNKSNSPYVISEITKSGSADVTYTLDDYKIGQGLGKNSSTTFTITFKYNVSSLPQNRAQATELTFTFVKPYAEILKYDNKNSGTSCTNVQCALDELYEKLR